jgi:hypothetical protein
VDRCAVPVVSVSGQCQGQCQWESERGDEVGASQVERCWRKMLRQRSRPSLLALPTDTDTGKARRFAPSLLPHLGGDVGDDGDET